MSRETPGIPWRRPLYQLLIALPNLFSWRTGPSSNVCCGRDKRGTSLAPVCLIRRNSELGCFRCSRWFTDTLSRLCCYCCLDLFVFKGIGYNTRVDYLTAQVALGRNSRYNQETPQVLKRKFALDATIIEKLRNLLLVHNSFWIKIR